MASLAPMALDGGDPRLSIQEGTLAGKGIVAYTKPQTRRLHDPNVSFEEYFYYAQQTRFEEEEENTRVAERRGIVDVIFPFRSPKSAERTDEKRRASLVPQINTSDDNQRAEISDEEWVNASRAIRTAAQGSVFYLITTDILGPYALPFAFSSTGWG